VHESEEEGREEVQVFWRNASVWRVERRSGGVVSDGERMQDWQGIRRSASVPARPGHPHWFLQLAFPLRSPVLGRRGDDYLPTSAQPHRHGALVLLEGVEDDRRGHLVVDAEGFIREASFLSGRRTLRLSRLAQGPLDDADALFAVDA